MKKLIIGIGIFLSGVLTGVALVPLPEEKKKRTRVRIPEGWEVIQGGAATRGR